jgi:hypothetical protein
MFPRVSRSWIDPVVSLGMPALTADQAETVRGSMDAVSKNFVVHMHVRPVGLDLYNPNTIWNTFRNINASGSTSSYGAQLSMRLCIADMGATCTVMVSRDSKSDAPVPAEQVVCEVCILGIKDASTTYIVSHYVATVLLYELTGFRYSIIDIKLCNTLFVAGFPGMITDIATMARVLTAVHCVSHSNIEMVTMTVEIDTGPDQHKKRTATCNVWTTGAINIMGVPDEKCCNVALSRILPIVVRFIRKPDTPPLPKAAPVPRSAHIPPLDKQCEWGVRAVSRFASQVTRVAVHPRAGCAKEPQSLFIRPGMPLPLASGDTGNSTPDSDGDEGEFVR